MSEKMGPEQLSRAVMNTFVELSERDTEHKKENLKVIEKNFPDAVKDANQLWTTINSDIPNFTSFSAPSIFIRDLVEPQNGSPLSLVAKSSPNMEMYLNIYHKYIFITEDEIDKEEHASFTEEEKSKRDLRDLFDTSFELIRDISRAPHFLIPLEQFLR